MGKIGIDAEVQVQEADDKLKTEWSYAEIFYTIYFGWG
jgi:hypothetical protein